VYSAESRVLGGDDPHKKTRERLANIEAVSDATGMEAARPRIPDVAI